jgi:hypothetical protein
MMKNSPLEMIAEWRKGCSVAQKPEECPECTLALINALEKALKHHKDRLSSVDIVNIISFRSQTALNKDNDMIRVVLDMPYSTWLRLQRIVKAGND